MNTGREVAELATALLRLVPATGTVEHFSVAECLASMRDLGVFLGSLKRQGVEPVEVVPELEPVLMTLAKRTQMVPRDTVYHCALWSPPEPERARLYTGVPMELAMQNAVPL